MKCKTANPCNQVSASARHRMVRQRVLSTLLIALFGYAVAQAQPALIVYAVTHFDPGYIAQHVQWIESRPFDGIVINDFLGRNLFSSNLKNDAPKALDAGSGAVTYEAAAKGLSPIKGVFNKFHENFTKVNFSMTGAPPLLSDDTGWRIIRQSAANYAKAVSDTGLRGIFFDNEVYIFPPLSGRKNGANYWIYEDQIGLEGQSPSALPFPAAVTLARQRGREFMQALITGYPAIVVIVAHGPHEGCNSWHSASGHYAMDHYLLGAFVAGMVEGTSGAAMLVDGGEDYDLRTPRDFSTAREWRKGTEAHGGITNLGSNRCPFMDAALARSWQARVSIGFATFDKERTSVATSNWTPITDVASFRTTLTNALRATDHYAWHYAEWQNWWGNDMEDRLKPWIEAIEAARRDVGMDSRH